MGSWELMITGGSWTLFFSWDVAWQLRTTSNKITQQCLIGQPTDACDLFDLLNIIMPPFRWWKSKASGWFSTTSKVKLIIGRRARTCLWSSGSEPHRTQWQGFQSSGHACLRCRHQACSYCCCDFQGTARLLNLGYASGCTFISTERQKCISGNYSLIISQLSTLVITRDKNKTDDCLGVSKVILNAIGWTQVLHYHQVSLMSTFISTFLISHTWLLCSLPPSLCLHT